MATRTFLGAVQGGGSAIRFEIGLLRVESRLGSFLVRRHRTAGHPIHLHRLTRNVSTEVVYKTLGFVCTCLYLYWSGVLPLPFNRCPDVLFYHVGLRKYTSYLSTLGPRVNLCFLFLFFFHCMFSG